MRQNFPDLEVIVLNDGLENDAKIVCAKYGERVQCVWTGRTKQNNSLWRVPGYALNIGARKAKGQMIILTSAEIWHVDDCLQKLVETVQKEHKALAITNGYDDESGEVLKALQNNTPLLKNAKKAPWL